MKLQAKGELYGRAIPEWVGKTPDTPVPDSVQLRVLLRQSRLDAITGKKIGKGQVTQCDHIKKLKAGGQNRESNLQIIFVDTHKEKTARENTEEAKVRRIQKKELGIVRKSQTIKQRNAFKKFVSNTKYINVGD